MGGVPLGAGLLSDGRNPSAEAIKSAASETYTNAPAAICDKDAPVPAHWRRASNVQWKFHKLPEAAEGDTLELLDSLLSCIEEVISERSRHDESFQNDTMLSRDVLSSESSTCARQDDKESNLKDMIVALDQIMDEWEKSCGRSAGKITCVRDDDKERNLKEKIVALDQIMDEWVKSCGWPQNGQLNTAVVNLGADHPSGGCETAAYNPLASSTTDGYEELRMFESTMRQISEGIMGPGMNNKSVFWSLFGSRIAEVFKSLKGRIHSIPARGLKSPEDSIKMNTCHAYTPTVFQSQQEGTVGDNCRENEVPLSNRNSSSSTCPLGAGAIEIPAGRLPSPEHVYEECKPKLDYPTLMTKDSVYELVGPSDPTLN